MNNKNATVCARVDEKLKDDVEGILARLGLTMSDAINALLQHIKSSKGLPFEGELPNKLTQQTLRQSAQGKGVSRFKSIEHLFEDLER